MCLAVGQTACHAVALVELMQEDISALGLFYGIVDPDFILGYEFIDVIVAAGCKVDVKDAPDQTAVDDPNAKAAFKGLPQPLMHVLARRQLLAVMGHFPEIACAPPLLPLFSVSLDECLGV